MIAITVQTKQAYQVLVGTGLLDEAGKLFQKVKVPCKVAVISDCNVWPLYGATLLDGLTSSGYNTVSYVVRAGESSKSIETYVEILNFLAINGISRSDLIVALGGGVIGDLAGFVAATYLRGISYIQIPTSLLAMVDSSVGGKTGIDITAGKNLVGAFKQPSLVICDISVLSTLPELQFLDGCAEVIKYGMLYDQEMITYLQETGPEFDLEHIIAKCITFKRDVVHKDEFDTGIRQKLNFGHTVGHSIEAISNYQISHGQAVAIGMSVITAAAASEGICAREVSEELDVLLAKFKLQTKTSFTIEQLLQYILIDKKIYGNYINLIVPKHIGDCAIFSMPVDSLKSFIEAGLQ